MIVNISARFVGPLVAFILLDQFENSFQQNDVVEIDN